MTQATTPSFFKPYTEQAIHATKWLALPEGCWADTHQQCPRCEDVVKICVICLSKIKGLRGNPGFSDEEIVSHGREIHLFHYIQVALPYL